MIIGNGLLISLATALGIGLLIGAERERNKGTGPGRSPAGIRTFTIASLLGAISIIFNFWLLVVSVLCVMIFVAVAYFSRHGDDPGLTTEISLVFTVILGGLAMTQAALAGALAVAVAVLLAAKEPMHGFVSKVITKNELNDFLVLAAATLIILPLVPNQYLGPFEAINPRNLWLVVILIMLIGALGHIALRWMGGRIGLPVAGFVSGFISSVATIGSMGERAKHTANLTDSAAAGAVFSNVATILQLAILLAATHPPTLLELTYPLIAGGITVAIYGAWLTLLSHKKTGQVQQYQPKKPFSIKTALMLTAIIAIVSITSAAIRAWFGDNGLLIASAAAGLADVHAATISVASLAAANGSDSHFTVLPILAAISTNTIAKAVMASIHRNRIFTQRVMIALLIQIGAIWLTWIWL